MSWQDARADSFCEGYLWKQIVPGFDEFFSGLSGVVIVGLGIFGLMQPRLEMLLRLVYASIVVSGVGTMMLHWKRINGFNLADTLPLLVTLSLAMIAFFDEVFFEYWRERAADGGMLPVRDPLKEVGHEKIRNLLTSFFYTVSLCYLIVGIMLLVYSDLEFIFGLYFGIPFGMVAIGGLIFLDKRYHKHRLPQAGRLRLIMCLAISMGLISIGFKVLDSSFCSETVIWLFPHPLFHILLTYSTHCCLICMAFHRANNSVMEGERKAHLDWTLKIFPKITI